MNETGLRDPWSSKM